MKENPSANPDASYGPTHVMKMWIIAIQVTMITIIASVYPFAQDDASDLLRETPQEARDMFRRQKSSPSPYHSDRDLVRETENPLPYGASDHDLYLLYLVKESGNPSLCGASDHDHDHGLVRETDYLPGGSPYCASDHDLYLLYLVKEAGNPSLCGADDHDLYLVKESEHPSLCGTSHNHHLVKETEYLPGGCASDLSRENPLANPQMRLSRRFRILLKGRRTNPNPLDFSARRRRRRTRPPMAFGLLRGSSWKF